MRYSLRTLLIVLLTLCTLPLPGQEQPDPGKVLYGEWQIVEMVYRRKPDQNFGGQAGSFFFEPGGFIYASNKEFRDRILRNKQLKKVITERCIIREHEIDIWAKPVIGTKGEERLMECSYELRDGKLRLIWCDGPGERPTDFDEAVKDPALTLFVLNKRPNCHLPCSDSRSATCCG